MNLSNNKLIFIYSHCSPMSSSPMIGRTFVKGQGGSALIPKTVLRMNREGLPNNQRFVLTKNYILKLHSSYKNLLLFYMNVLMFTKIYYSSWTTAAVNGGKELPILNTIALGQQNIRPQHPFQGMYLNKNVLSSRF